VTRHSILIKRGIPHFQFPFSSAPRPTFFFKWSCTAISANFLYREVVPPYLLCFYSLICLLNCFFYYFNWFLKCFYWFFYTKVKNKKYYFNIFLIKKHFQKLPYITLLITYSNNDAPSITVMFGVDTASISALNSNIVFKKNFIFFSIDL
jgi:hypothetical protein